MEKIVQTAGRNALGEFAPEFARLNDDVLFEQEWNRTDKLSLRDRCIVTITALMSKGILDSSLQYHIQNAKNNGVAAPDSWFSHLAVEVPGENSSNEWLEIVTDGVYEKLK